LVVVLKKKKMKNKYEEVSSIIIDLGEKILTKTIESLGSISR